MGKNEIAEMISLYVAYACQYNIQTHTFFL